MREIMRMAMKQKQTYLQGGTLDPLTELNSLTQIYGKKVAGRKELTTAKETKSCEHEHREAEHNATKTEQEGIDECQGGKLVRDQCKDWE